MAQTEYQKLWYQSNKERLKAKSRKNYHNNREANRVKKEEYYKKNRDKFLEKAKLRAKNKSEEIKDYKKDYYQKNKVAIHKKASESLKNNPHKRLMHNIRVRLGKLLKRKPYSTCKGLGCNLEELKKYIESKFTEGMTWDNYGEWHLDHIRPLSSFNLEDPEEYLKACNYTNLQPLWAADNLAKGARYVSS